MSSITPIQEKLSEVANTNGDAIKTILDVTLNTSEQLMALNLNLARSCNANAVTPVDGDFRDQVNAQLKSPARALELFTDYMRNVGGICVRAQSEIARIDAERVSDVTKSVKSLLDGFAKSSPKGSVEVIDQIKSALTHASEAYENMIRTTSDIVESNLDTANKALEPIVAKSMSMAATKVSKKAA